MTSAELWAALVPEYAADARRDTFLAIAAARLSASAWGELYAQGAVLLAAHLLKLADLGAAAPSGPVSGRSALTISEQYAVAATGRADDQLRRTSYGTSFLELRAQLAATAPTVVLV